MRIISLTCLLVLYGALFARASDAAQDDLLIVPANVWTADGDSVKAGWAVRVHDGVIAAVGPLTSLQAAPDVIRIDLPGATLTPGLIDLHVHLFLHPYNETPWNDQIRHDARAGVARGNRRCRGDSATVEEDRSY